MQTVDPDVAREVWEWVRGKRWCPPGDLQQPSYTFPLGATQILLLQVGENLVQVPVTSDLEDASASPIFWGEWAVLARVDAGTRAALLQASRKVRPLGAEQSNTSVLLEGGRERLIAKIFRVLHAGDHPEVELPNALRGWEGVPALVAHLDLPGGVCSGVVSEAIEDATDGFDYFRSGVYDPDAARALGRTVAAMHERLYTAFGAGPESTPAKRLNTNDVPEEFGDSLAVFAEPLRDAVTETARIHGDLHLGQCLRKPDGSWVVLDFEGEPLRPLSERTEPDSPLRDVAGVLRSFDYALEPTARDAAQSEFLAGYGEQIDPDILNVYEIEKALYELRYEQQFRPHMAHIPLAALRRKLGPYERMDT